MPKIRNKAAMMFAAVAGSLMVLPATQASANCVNYAKLSLQQQKKNVANNCGKSGPEWQADMRTLMKWCASKSPQDAQARLNMRKEALEACGAN